MNGEVASDGLLDLSSFEAHHMSVVTSPIEVPVRVDGLTLLVSVSVDESSESWDLSDQTDDIIVARIPVLGLVDTIRIGFSELAGWLETEKSHRELSHWVHIDWEVLDELFDLSRYITLLLNLSGDILELVVLWDFSSKQKPEDSFRERLMTIWGLLELLSDSRDAVATSELDTLVTV